MTSDQLRDGFCPHSRYTPTAPRTRRSFFPPNEFLQIICFYVVAIPKPTNPEVLCFTFIRRRLTDPPAPHRRAKAREGRSQQWLPGSRLQFKPHLLIAKAPVTDGIPYIFVCKYMRTNIYIYTYTYTNT